MDQMFFADVYRYNVPGHMQVFLSFQLGTSHKNKVASVLDKLKHKGMKGHNISDNEMVKTHMQYLIGGTSNVLNEHLFQFSMNLSQLYVQCPQMCPPTESSFLVLPKGDGMLPMWQIAMAATMLFNTVQIFVTLHLTKCLYNNVPVAHPGNMLWLRQPGEIVPNMPRSLFTIPHALYSAPKASGCWSSAFPRSGILLLDIGRTVVSYYRSLEPPDSYLVNRCHP